MSSRIDQSSISFRRNLPKLMWVVTVHIYYKVKEDCIRGSMADQIED